MIWKYFSFNFIQILKTSQHFRNSGCMSSKFFARVWVISVLHINWSAIVLCHTAVGLILLLMSSADTHRSWIRVDSLVYTTSVPPILPFCKWVITNLLLMFLSHKHTLYSRLFSLIAWPHTLTCIYFLLSRSLSHTHTHTHTRTDWATRTAGVREGTTRSLAVGT